MKLKRRLMAMFIVVGSLFIHDIAGAAVPCGQWRTVSSTPKTASACNRTVIGPWKSPVGGCLRWVSWRDTQHKIPVNNGSRNERSRLHNEVQMQIKVGYGPLAYTRTQTVWGSHTTTITSQGVRIGHYACSTGGWYVPWRDGLPWS